MQSTIIHAPRAIHAINARALHDAAHQCALAHAAWLATQPKTPVLLLRPWVSYVGHRGERIDRYQPPLVPVTYLRRRVTHVTPAHN
jgi:hypothetical protein